MPHLHQPKASLFQQARNVWLMCLAGLATVAVPAAQRLDDSASPRRNAYPTVTDAQGRPLDLKQMPTEVMLQYGRLEYRLATAAYMGKQARVYFVMPAYVPGLWSPAGMRAQWQGSGAFSDGSARPGERALVWSGTVREPWLAGSLQLTYHVNPRQMQKFAGGAIEPYFEIEPWP